MQTLLLYLLVMAAAVIVVFAVVWFVFGRGEELPPLEPDTTLTTLPRAGIAGSDVRELRFAQTFRGYKQSEVDWALEKLARELDELRAVVVTLQGREANDFSADTRSPSPPAPVEVSRSVDAPDSPTGRSPER
ncbi:DivIVA domain-containing protein [Williamsia sterculiae]|uniref:DivIVA domain-containing protein n=1 Tax=Williamsia sterculiae TaxID=1344003 RepID=A0A1N7FR23_9NOCA|nr:DivIVA domain-containing protein [Williamsia sterculiae]SIS02822.1 DivIVA domain-containing protein [Williamsia sterculiae]